MNCRTCGYALWNLPGRTCPECGAPFLPSEFEFVANSVRFMCPHCGQPYYGTGAKGHLVPVEFDCVRCAARVHMDRMVLLPAAGVREDDTIPQRLPWAERSTRGFVRGWLGTIAMAVFSPTRLIRAARHTGPTSACWFAFITWVVAVVGGVSPVLVWFLARPGNVRPAGVYTFGLPILVWGGIWAGLVAVWGLLAHALLRVTGPTAGGIGRTYVAILFSSAITVIGAVPCVGAYLMFLVIPLWWAILAIIMLREEHRVRAWRATVAGLLAPVLGYATLVGLWIMLVSASMTRVTVAVAAAQTAQASVVSSSRTTGVLAGLRVWSTPDGVGPVHAGELLSSGLIQPGDVALTSVSGTLPEDVSVGSMTLARFENSPPAERIAAVRVAVLRQPPGTIAHRLGDFVFTYHGIDLRRPDPRLWLVVFSPDPRSTPPQIGLAINPIVGLGDGTTAQFAPEFFAAAVAQQNAVRAEFGLPPLPDPRHVTEDAPATAP